MDSAPMHPGIGGEKNGPGAADDPADFVRRSGATCEIRKYIADLSRPGGASITRKFNHPDVPGAPENFSPRRRDHRRVYNRRHSQRSTIVERRRRSRRRRRSLSGGSGRKPVEGARLRFSFLRQVRMPGWIGAGNFLVVYLVLLRLKVLQLLLVLRLSVCSQGLHLHGFRYRSGDSGFGILSGLILSAIRSRYGIQSLIRTRVGLFVSSGFGARNALPRTGLFKLLRAFC